MQDVIDIVLAVGRVLEETINVVELVSTSLSTIKQDNGTVTESAVKLFGSVNGDSGLVTDSGSLYSQGYTVGLTYFAEQYVGDSLTF
jgi:hypothetical protein